VADALRVANLFRDSGAHFLAFILFIDSVSSSGSLMLAKKEDSFHLNVECQCDEPAKISPRIGL
jgi:hypothetical protein